jgi:hypothetical protein
MNASFQNSLINHSNVVVNLFLPPNKDIRSPSFGVRSQSAMDFQMVTWEVGITQKVTIETRKKVDVFPDGLFRR